MNSFSLSNCIILFSISLSLITSSCKTVNVAKPAEEYSNVTHVVKPSIVSFTAESKIIDIQNVINKSFTGLIYEDKSLDDNGGDNLMIKAWKQGDIKLDMKGNVLHYRVPLKTWIKAGFKIDKFGISLSDYRELNAALALNFKTVVTLNPDWTVSTKTTSDGYEWLSTPVVNVGGIDMSVKFVADLIMQSSLKDMGKLIDESVKDYLNLRPYVKQAWDLVNQPIKLNDQYNVWLEITPQKLISSRLNAINGSIVHKAGITGNIKLSMNSLAPQTASLKELPELLIGEIPVETSTLYAYVTMPFDEISKTTTTYIKGRTYSYGKRSVTVDDIRIYGNQGNLIAETTLSGSLKGTIYFIGKPVYNSSDSSIVISDFNYDLSTKNFLVKSASWLYQDGFRKMIASYLKWGISKEMKLVRSTVNNSLKNYEVIEGVILKGNIDRIEPDEILITPAGITPVIKAEGRIGIQINQMSFKP